MNILLKKSKQFGLGAPQRPQISLFQAKFILALISNFLSVSTSLDKNVLFSRGIYVYYQIRDIMGGGINQGFKKEEAKSG